MREEEIVQLYAHPPVEVDGAWVCLAGDAISAVFVLILVGAGRLSAIMSRVSLLLLGLL